jgi:hypothetical protein
MDLEDFELLLNEDVKEVETDKVATITEFLNNSRTSFIEEEQRIEEEIERLEDYMSKSLNVDSSMNTKLSKVFLAGGILLTGATVSSIFVPCLLATKLIIGGASTLSYIGYYFSSKK